MSRAWLVLYLATWVLHFVLVSHVLVGSGYALVQSLRGRDDDPLAARARDLLPFMLGCGITAGVAPLLFLQLLYQERFYTANLLLGPRWGAVVPALIVGFYALYLQKAATTATWRRLALAAATGCFLFVAWSWTELHLVMRDDPSWVAMYAAGDRFYGQSGVLPRLLLWLGVMPVLFAGLAAWWARGAERQRLAIVAFAGHVIAGVAVAWLSARGSSIDPGTRGWLYLLIAALVIEVFGWVLVLRRPEGPGLAIVTGAGTAAMLGLAVVRESPRLALVSAHPAALEARGAWVFAVTAVFAVAAIAWVVKTIRE